MLDSFQALTRADAATARFLATFIAVLVPLYLLSALYSRFVPRPSAPSTHGRKPLQSHIQRTAKSVAVRFANWVASLPIAPNQITLIGLALVVFCCALFLYHRNSFIFGTSLIVAYLFDTLDGVVARAQGRSSKFGGYLDAVVDRYQEVVTYLAVGMVTNMWAPVFLVMTGSLLISYNKARAALEVDIDNKGWPDLLEKPTRLFILCAALICDSSLPWMLSCTLWALAFMTHFTAVQRIVRGYLIISRAETGRPASTKIGTA